WLGMLSYIHRSPTSLFGMDTILVVVVLYLCIGPCGAALSVDQWLRRAWAARQALRHHQPVPTDGRPAPSISANVATRLLQIHVCMIYAASGLSKLLGSSWWSGGAVWGTVANYEFSPMDVPAYMAMLRYITQHRWLAELLMTSGTYFT